jgi:hypothetical protein
MIHVLGRIINKGGKIKMAKREMEFKKEDDVVTVQTETTVTDLEPEKKEVEGKIVNCRKLNIRKSPSVPKKNPLSNVITIVDDKANVIVDLGKSNDGWYKVTVNGDVSGYCMTEYISIK